MLIYRAECEDGGGPMYKLDGTPRYNWYPPGDGSTIISGADSYEHLAQLINHYTFNIEDYIIVVYEANESIIYNKRNGHITFDKTKAKEVSRWTMESMI